MGKVVLRGIDWIVDDEEERDKLPERIELQTDKNIDPDKLIEIVEQRKGYKILSCCIEMEINKKK